ncbi:MAG TPA: endolytic transglycosylase MltG [Elusimicrobiota bacterium]|nr:endolytic transglycosylase MltG [Elusimicrobiota bacterium]
MNRRGSAAFLLLFFLLCACAPGEKTPITVTIPEGSTATQIARLLREAGVIGSTRWFLFLVQLRKGSNRLHAGTYSFPPPHSAGKALAALKEGRTLTISVTIPEGYASWQIADKLEKAGICGGGAFLAEVSTRGAEGFLFPETYFLEKKTSPGQVIDVMRAQYETVWEQMVRTAADTGRLRVEFGKSTDVRSADVWVRDKRYTPKQILTLASLIEREARKPEERPLVSSVFHNRIRKRWYIESCATVQYSLGEWKPRLTYKDLDVPSPYNTYRHFGLPPGPICSPGKAALEAALFPADSEAMFFLADGQGSHTFYSSYEDHLRGKRHKRAERRKKR